MQDGLCADASEQTRQMTNAMTSSPCDSMRDSGPIDDIGALDGSGSAQPLHPDTNVDNRWVSLHVECVVHMTLAVA